MAEQLYFSRDSKLYVGFDSKVWEVPILDGFSFSQSTNQSEIGLSEMQGTDGLSRRGQRVFTDSLAPAEWSFSTYVRPYKSTEHGAVEEALFLTRFASKVIVVHRREKLRAEKILQERLFRNNKIEVLWNSKVIEFIGEENPQTLKQVILENTINSKKTKIDISGAFIAIGHDPATSLFKGKLEMDNENYIITKSDSTETSVKGVFAAGDVKDKIYRQAVTAAGMGCMAALEAEKFIADTD